MGSNRTSDIQMTSLKVSSCDAVLLRKDLSMKQRLSASRRLKGGLTILCQE